jgi:hypothetical protein
MTNQLPLDFTPAHQKHSPTSRAAADSIKPRVGPLHARILEQLDYLQNLRGRDGATDEELQQDLDMPANTRELQNMGLIVDSGTTRKTKSGRAAVVWKLATAQGPTHRGCSDRSEGAQ